MSKSGETFKSYRFVCKKAREVCGNIAVKALTRRHVDEFVTYWLGKGNKPVTINKNLRALRAIINKGKEWGYIKTNPLSRYKPLAVNRQPPRALSKEEVVRLLSAIDDHQFRLYTAFALYSGCCRGEILNLTWEDVDLEKEQIFIRKTKSHHSRYIPISRSLMAVLKQLAANTVRIGRLFPNWTPDWVSHKFKHYARKAKIECRLHDLRHTFATHLVAEGVPLRVLQDLLGHQDFQSTLVYAHTMEDIRREATEKIVVGLELIEGGKS